MIKSLSRLLLFLLFSSPMFPCQGCSGMVRLPDSSDSYDEPNVDGDGSSDVNSSAYAPRTDRECGNAVPHTQPSSRDGILRILREEKNCGQYRRVDDATIITDGIVIVELMNIYDKPLYYALPCDIASDYLAILVEGVNDKWGLGVGHWAIAEGCNIPPGRSLMMDVDVRSGGNLRHYESRIASEVIKSGCYKAKLANGPYLLDIEFELCLEE